MRRHAAVGLAWALIACGEPVLSVQVNVAEPYASPIATARVLFLTPPPGDPFDCDGLAFSTVSDAKIEAATIARMDGPVTGETIEAIDNTGTKLVWITASLADGRPLVTGCDVVDPIDSDMPVVIDTFPVATSSVAAAAAILGVRYVGEPFGATSRVLVTDALGGRLAGVDVQVDTRGTDGVLIKSDTMTNADGFAEVKPVVPAVAGPYSVDIRVRWGVATTAGVPGLAVAKIDGQVPRWSLGGSLGDAAVTSGGRLAVSVFDNGLGALIVLQHPLRPGDALTVPNVNVQAGTIIAPHAANESFVLVSDSTWREVAAIGFGVQERPLDKPMGATSPVRLLDASPCDDSAGRHALVFADGTTAIYGGGGLLGPLVPPLPGHDLLDAACLDGVVTQLHARADGEPEIVVGAGSARGLGFARGAHFSPAEFEGGARPIVSTLSLGEWAIATGTIDGDMIRLKQFALPRGQPLSMDSGDFDGDGKADVAALAKGRNANGDDAIVLVVALATGVVGRASLGQLCEAARVFVTDFDGNGRDDIAVVNLGCAEPFLIVLTH